MWALGVIIYMLLCGFPPFFDTNIKNMFYQIKKAKFHFPSPFWDTISDQAKDLIKKLLVVDAKKRYTASQLLKHPWITGEFFEEEEHLLIDNVPLPPELPESHEPSETKTNDEHSGAILSDVEPSPKDTKEIKETTEKQERKDTPHPITSPPLIPNYIAGAANGILSPVQSSPNSMIDIGSTIGSDGGVMSEKGSVVMHPSPSPFSVDSGSNDITGKVYGVIGTPINTGNNTKELRIDTNADKTFSDTSSSIGTSSPKKNIKIGNQYLQSPESNEDQNQNEPERIMKRTRSDPLQGLKGLQTLQTPPVPFHVDSELFPDSDDMDNLDLNPINDETNTESKTKDEPHFRKTQTLDRSQIENVRRKHRKKIKGKRPRVDTRGNTNVAYMGNGTIFQIQKQQINKLKMEIQTEQQNLDKLSNQLQAERQQFLIDRQQFEQEKIEWEKQKEKWRNEHEHLLQLKMELNDIINKFLTFKHPK